MCPCIEDEYECVFSFLKLLPQQVHYRRFTASPGADQGDRLPALLIPDKLGDRIRNLLM